MSRNWADERYVRLYVRDTFNWISLRLNGQAVLTLLLRKADRSGVVDLGTVGRAAVPIVLGHPADAEFISAGLQLLEDQGVVKVVTRDTRTALVFPNFLDAQEATSADAERKRKERQKRAALAANADILEPIPSQGVTVSHKIRPNVTPYRAVPYRAEEGALAPGSGSISDNSQTQVALPGSEAYVRVEVLREVWNTNRTSPVGCLAEWTETPPARQRLALEAIAMHDPQWWAQSIRGAARDPWATGTKRGARGQPIDVDYLLTHADQALRFYEKSPQPKARREARVAGEVLRCSLLGCGQPARSVETPGGTRNACPDHANQVALSAPCAGCGRTDLPLEAVNGVSECGDCRRLAHGRCLVPLCPVKPEGGARYCPTHRSTHCERVDCRTPRDGVQVVADRVLCATHRALPDSVLNTPIADHGCEAHQQTTERLQ